ncbi:MAG: biotin--[Prevotella sp.]|nr:biotin--[acetyl-CoA-carboxylase] ligase [Prevotella sp.]
MTIKTIHIAETDSTNTWLKANGGEEDVLAWTDYQTAGRGCGSNTWESETGKNLLFSVLYHPQNVPAPQQFILSMANALAIKEALDAYADDIMVKWPNDIYWHDRKLAGTLIETSLMGGAVKTCILGTGLNVNQRVFHSDAPNPVSLCQMLGHEVDREELLQLIINRLEDYMDMVESRQWASIRTSYRACLYRRDGREHLFKRPQGDALPYVLNTVDDDGTLVLLRDGQEERFGFKEIQFIL